MDVVAGLFLMVCLILYTDKSDQLICVSGAQWLFVRVFDFRWYMTHLKHCLSKTLYLLLSTSTGSTQEDRKLS